jgi:hypothetical protein
MFLALIASLVLSLGLVVACGDDDDDDDDDDTADDDTDDDDDDADDDAGDDCLTALGDNVEACFSGVTTEEVCADPDADCWVACFNASETCGDWQACLEASCGVVFE